MNYFEVKFNYDKEQDNEDCKRVSVSCIVEASTFAQVEDFVKGFRYTLGKEPEIISIKKSKYSYLIKNNDPDANIWYNCKLKVIVQEEKTSKDKAIYYYYLVQGTNLNDAKNRMVTFMNNSTSDYEFAKIEETQIFGVHKN